MTKILCAIFGHRPVLGPLKRSPYTVYTHWQETHCERCKTMLRRELHYKDALSEPQFFTRNSDREGDREE